MKHHRKNRAARTGQQPMRKVNVYLPADLAAEIEHEAERLDRSVTWLLERSWLLARDRVRDLSTPLPSTISTRELADQLVRAIATDCGTKG